MSVPAHRLGPGILEFGASGTLISFAARARKVEIKHDVDEDDPVPVLSGDEIEGDETETYTIGGSIFQDYSTSSPHAWAHKHAGQIVPWSFTPDADKALKYTGFVKVRRLDVGGDVKARNETEFEWPGRNGMYRMVDADSGEDLDWTAPTGTVTPPEVDPSEWD